MNTAERGRLGETLAAALLERLGYRILHRNLRTPEGEIDIIARDGETLVFVEVKARATRRYGSAISAVDAKKRRRLRESAANFLQFVPDAAKTIIRFDVVTLEHGTASVVRDAF